MQPPDGPPVCAALKALPSGMPPPMSSTIWRSVIPIGTSMSPVFTRSPASANTFVPVFAFSADRREPVCALAHDRRDVGEGLDVVDHRRGAPEAPFGWVRGTQAWDAPAAFDRGEKRRLLTANECTRPNPDVDVERELGVEDVATEETLATRDPDRAIEALDGSRVFGTHVDVGLGSAGGICRDRRFPRAGGADRLPSPCGPCRHRGRLRRRWRRRTSSSPSDAASSAHFDPTG